jgi:hypothetical protein
MIIVRRLIPQKKPRDEHNSRENLLRPLAERLYVALSPLE